MYCTNSLSTYIFDGRIGENMLEDCEHIYVSETFLQEDGILVNEYLWFDFIGVYVGFFGVYLSCMPSKRQYVWKERLIALEDFKKDYNVPDDFILVNMTYEVAREAKDNYCNTGRGCFSWLDTPVGSKSAFYINPYGEPYDCSRDETLHILPALLVPTNLMKLKSF